MAQVTLARRLRAGGVANFFLQDTILERRTRPYCFIQHPPALNCFLVLNSPLPHKHTHHHGRTPRFLSVYQVGGWTKAGRVRRGRRFENEQGVLLGAL